MLVGIIGGSGGFGKWLAKYIKNNFPQVNVVITGRNIEKLKSTANEISVNFSTNNAEVAKKADVLIFAVPISSMQQTIEDLAPLVKSGAVIADVCSVKTFPAETMKKSISSDVLIIPTHPMFGPYIDNIASQVFVLTPDDKTKKDLRYQWLKNYLISKGAKVIETTPSYHDKIMSIVQGLNHLIMFSVARILYKMNIKPEETFDFVSPIYKLLISSVSRYMGHNFALYADIQIFNPFVKQIYKLFDEVLEEFFETVDLQHKDKFVSLVEEAKNIFTGKIIQSGQKFTDKLNFFVSSQRKIVLENTGKKICYENIYSQQKSSGVIEKVVEDEVYLSNGKILDLNENVFYLCNE